MSSSEYLNWIRYFEGKEADRKQNEEIGKGNILAMDSKQVIGAMTGGS